MTKLLQAESNTFTDHRAVTGTMDSQGNVDPPKDSKLVAPPFQLSYTSGPAIKFSHFGIYESLIPSQLFLCYNLCAPLIFQNYFSVIIYVSAMPHIPRWVTDHELHTYPVYCNG
jgi:hypothetical protein